MSETVKTTQTPMMAPYPSLDDLAEDSGLLRAKSDPEKAHMVVTEKLDGVGLRITSEGIETARDVSGRERRRLSKFFDVIGGKIPSEIEVYAVWCPVGYKLKYAAIPTGPHVHSIFSEGTWLSWEQVRWYANFLKLPYVPFLYVGNFANSTLDVMLKQARGLAGRPSVFGPERKGIVIRRWNAFSEDEYGDSIAQIDRFSSKPESPIRQEVTMHRDLDHFINYVAEMEEGEE